MDLILGKQRFRYQCFLLTKRFKQVTTKIKKIMNKTKYFINIKNIITERSKNFRILFYTENIISNN